MLKSILYVCVDVYDEYDVMICCDDFYDDDVGGCDMIKWGVTPSCLCIYQYMYIYILFQIIP